MEADVTTVLADFRLTAWDVFGDRGSLPGFTPSRRTASQAAGGPHSSRNLWQPQVTLTMDLVFSTAASWNLLVSFERSTFDG